MVLAKLKEIGLAIISTLLTEKFLISLFIYVAEKLAAKTENKIDDAIVAKIKEALQR